MRRDGQTARKHVSQRQYRHGQRAALMCDVVDVYEVIDAAATKPFGFIPFYPGPGLGGHCIPIDPHYLAWKLKALNFQARFIGLAAEINGMMPSVVTTMVGEGLNRFSKSIRGSKVLILGVAYKKNVSDCRSLLRSMS